MSSRIKKISITYVKPYFKNPVYTEANLEHVRDSIERYGYNQYISVDEDNVIVTGHCRYKALLQLGFNDIYVIELYDIPQKQIDQYRLVDNATGDQRQWDTEKLIEELESMNNDLDLEALFPGFILRGQDEQEGPEAGQTSKVELDDEIELMCPYCEEEFTASRNKILEGS